MENIRIPWPGWTAVRRIGEGSSGTVYEIERFIGGMKEKAALKIITIPKSQDDVESDREYGFDDQGIARKYENYRDKILTEYLVMMSMKGHSNIVSCEDIYEEKLESGIGWRIYIRMEYLTPLLKYRREHPFGEKGVLKVAEDLCQALVLCEQKNIVHRDIKPENIMVSDYGSFKLGDFGIARTMDHTTTATGVGTKPYMAPEVVKGEEYNHKVDIYSLGLVLYWLLNNGKLPFMPQDRVPDFETSQNAYNRRIRGDELPVPVNGSSSLKKIVLKACAYKPSDRYGSAKEMLDALNRLKITETENESDNAKTDKVFIVWDDPSDSTGKNRWLHDSVSSDPPVEPPEELPTPGHRTDDISNENMPGGTAVTDLLSDNDRDKKNGHLGHLIAALAAIVFIAFIVSHLH